MDQQNLGAQQDFQMSMENTSNDPKQRYFNQIIMSLQQIILDEELQSAQNLFMNENYDHEIKNLGQAEQLWKLYQNSIGQLLIQKIKTQIPDFDLKAFGNQLRNRSGQIDEEIRQLILSCVDIETFKGLFNDYKIAQEQQERYKVLTVKTNKLPQNKKVKGNNQNIFGASSVPNFGSKAPTKKTSTKVSEKTLQQLLVPQTVLTVKGLRKS